MPPNRASNANRAAARQFNVGKSRLGGVGDPPGGDVIGKTTTLTALFPLQSEKVVFVLNDPPDDFVSGKVKVHARIVTATDVHECRADNNASEPVSGRCLLE